MAPEGQEWLPGRGYDIVGPLGGGEGRESVVFRVRKLRPPQQAKEFALKMVVHLVGERAVDRAGHTRSTALARGMGAEWREPMRLPPHECLVPVLHHYHSDQPRVADHVEPMFRDAVADAPSSWSPHSTHTARSAASSPASATCTPPRPSGSAGFGSASSCCGWSVRRPT